MNQTLLARRFINFQRKTENNDERYDFQKERKYNEFYMNDEFFSYFAEFIIKNSAK